MRPARAGVSVASCRRLTLGFIKPFQLLHQLMKNLHDPIFGDSGEPLPRRGHFSIYDRSWYGRVLVERIEGLCRPDDWRRAFAEINSFEEELAEFGTLVFKFWLAITKDVQLTRFEQRRATSYKQYKITPDDWRNREKWDAYEAAACEVIERTSTELAPWNLIEANDKLLARTKVLGVICDGLQELIEAR